MELTSIYVGTRLWSRVDGSEICEQDVVTMLINGQSVLVTATAGAGKTFFAKYVFLALLASEQRLPIMVELRNLNNSDLGIVDYILNELKASGVGITRDMTTDLIKSGRFVIVLDGYDELAKNKIDEVNEELRLIERNIGSGTMLITSRPESGLDYFSDLQLYEVLSLSKEQAIDLINKLDYDEKVKKSFLREIKSGLYDKNREFLANPLLLTIMLMTYSDIAEIPNKMHVFYDQAFDVLFYRHDASKGLYRREMYSGLAIDDFKNILSSVAMSGYMREQFAHSNTELLNYIRKAKQITGVKRVSPDSFKKDLLQSVCILIEEGHRYVYNHRSFQEYFAALFLCNVKVANKYEVYRRCLRRGLGENALELAFEMGRGSVESEFVLPMLREIDEYIDEGPIKTIRENYEVLTLTYTPKRYYRSNERKIRVRKDNPVLRANEASDHALFAAFVSEAYGPIYKSKAPKRVGQYFKIGRMREVLGKDPESSIKIKTNSMSKKEIEILEYIGLTNMISGRNKFLKWLHGEIEKRFREEGADIDKLL